MKKLIDAGIIDQREKAFLIEVSLESGPNMECWFPKSAIEVEIMDNGGEGDIYIQEWMLELKQDEINEIISAEEKQY